MSGSELSSKEIILQTVLPLFADKGYEGVSMRQIAKTVGMRPASLYHHFPDKKTLYLEALARAFTSTSSLLLEGLTKEGTAQQRFERIVRDMVQDRLDNPVFHQIISREILDGDDERLKQLSTQVFAESFQKLVQFLGPITKKSKPDQLVMSLIAIIHHHYDTASIRRHLPGYDKKSDDKETFINHVLQLFMPLIAQTPATDT
ncbi:MAG: TetR/AcrR family transcriptional regulator [Magnetococcales bacterium]|nr:TetR/AcrR family transcriptional regulator [Magnetococcales bacterium]